MTNGSFHPTGYPQVGLGMEQLSPYSIVDRCGVYKALQVLPTGGRAVWSERCSGLGLHHSQKNLQEMMVLLRCWCQGGIHESMSMHYPRGE